ncbi:hypothetical protein [Desulfocurvus sp. DL9XJH121]
MIEGLYGVQYRAQDESFFTTIVIKNGKLYGGDHSYYYYGSYCVTEDTLMAVVYEKRWTDVRESLFGPVDEAVLLFRGKIHGEDFSGTGESEAHPGVTIHLTGKKLADLDGF